MPCIFSPLCLCSREASYYSATRSTRLAKANPDVLHVKGALRPPCSHGNKHMTLTSLCHLHCHTLNAYYVPGTASGASPYTAFSHGKYKDPLHSTSEKTKMPAEVTYSGSCGKEGKAAVTFYVWLQTQLFLYHTSDS